jgi:molybdopterin synthase sulfur carrier subunit
MATVRVLYFAGLRDALGLSEESLELPGDVRTIADFCAHLAQRHRAYAVARQHVRVAKNESFADADEPVGDGDTLALIPPVSGG